MTDQLIGNYKVLKQIGAGGMAKVYLAVHKDIPNLKVILKILSDPRLVQRFKQEADKLALLDGHPNICRIKHFFTHGEDVVIAMEYIDGQTLEDKLKTEGHMPIGESIRIIENVLDILAFAHERGVYHRDIKPSNIMIDQAGTVKIIDFGIAKGESDPNLTIAGTACGTPAFMAPEQFTPSDSTDYARVDVYATGTTLYRMLTGELPFKGDNEFALRDAKLFTDPPKPRTLASGIPRDLEACILRSMEKQPEDRYPSAGEMRKALTAISGEAREAQAERTMDMAASLPKPTKKKPMTGIFGLAAVIILVAAAVGYWLLSDSTPTAPPAVTLLTPTDTERFSEHALPTLTWSETAGESGSYIIEYASDVAFSDGRTIAGITRGSYTFSSPLDNGEYFWRVYPVGTDGSRGDPEIARSFVIDVPAAPPPQGLLRIVVNPRGDIYLDGSRKARGLDRYEATVDTGRHVIMVENAGSRERRLHDTVYVSTDDPITRTYRFTFPPAPEPAVTLGEVRVGSRPRGADIYIDGQLQPQKTNYTFTLSPGRHIIRSKLLVEGGELDRADTVFVVADSTHKVIFDFQ